MAGPREPGTPGPSRVARDRDLAREGWTRRFTGGPPRLSEVKELYETIGLEVLLDDLTPDELPEDCDGCVVALSFFRAIYTRRPREGSADRPTGGVR